MPFLIENQFIIVHLEEHTSLEQPFNLKKKLHKNNMMQEGNKGPSEAEEKHFFSALKKRFDFGGANPEAKESEPKNSKQMTKTPPVYFKTPLVVYKEKEQNVACTYCLAGTSPNQQPSVWTKCKDNSDLNNTYEEKEFDNFALMDLTPYTDEESYYFNQNQMANRCFEPTGLDEEYFTQDFYGTSSNNLYWPEEVAQMNLTPYSDDEAFYNQTTYFSANENQVDNVWLEPSTGAFYNQTTYFSANENQVDNVWLQPSTGFWFNNTFYF